MHSTRHASHKRYDLPKMHNRCSAPKLQCIKYVPNLALSTQGFSCDWYIWRTVQAITVRSFNSIQFIGCSVTNRGHRSLYIDSDAGGKRRLGVLRHEDREVFAWVRFFAWISKCPSGHCYYWLLDWITLLVKFSGNFRFLDGFSWRKQNNCKDRPMSSNTEPSLRVTLLRKQVYCDLQSAWVQQFRWS